jgi:hypothetical protein
LCPVTTANDAPWRRSVIGIPANASAPKIADTPGTTSNGTPASAQALASSPPRPNTYGSPPLSRTTVLPSAASRRSSAVVSSCVRVGASWPRLPTSMRSAFAGARSSSAFGASAS